MEINMNEMNEEYSDLMRRIAPVFASEPGYKNAKNYIKGLMGSAERKNGWQMSEYLGEATPYAMRQFIYRGNYSADELRDIGREYVVEHIALQL